jgi:dethiobiotin synthetase/adenosylmethionine--8-amino-7-oxononanoate aminotransferase
LHIRGYDLETILQFSDQTYQNHSYLKSYFNEKGVFSLAIPPPPPKGATEQEDYEAMFEYYEIMSKRDEVTETIHNLAESHAKRILKLEEMSSKAYKTIWYPFTQHNDISPETIMAIDSASGDFFQTHTTSSSTSTREAETKIENILSPTFDGSASWVCLLLLFSCSFSL